MNLTPSAPDALLLLCEQVDHPDQGGYFFDRVDATHAVLKFDGAYSPTINLYADGSWRMNFELPPLAEPQGPTT